MVLRDAVWSACHKLSPALHLTLKSILGARRSRRGELRQGQIARSDEFIRWFGAKVLSGPFTGLQFPRAAFRHNLVPKLTGAYEFQLHPFIERLIERQPTQVIDIGAAEGYYANGLARRLPNARVYAFDAAPGERAVCTRVALANNLTGRVTVGGICTTDWLHRHLRRGDLVFSDCEGGEDGLLDPGLIPALQACDLLVETHDQMAPDVTDRLVERFRATHEVHRVSGLLAPREKLPVVASWTPQDYERALSENRSAEQQWLVLLAQPPPAGAS